MSPKYFFVCLTAILTFLQITPFISRILASRYTEGEVYDSYPEETQRKAEGTSTDDYQDRVINVFNEWHIKQGLYQLREQSLHERLWFNVSFVQLLDGFRNGRYKMGKTVQKRGRYQVPDLFVTESQWSGWNGIDEKGKGEVRLIFFF